MGRANVASNLAGLRRWAKRLLEVITVPGKMEITMQTDQVVIFRKRRLRRVWCERCGCDVVAVDLQEAGKLSGMPALALPDGNVGAQGWHISARADDEPVVCLRSLLHSLPLGNRTATSQERKYEKPVQ